MSFGQAIRTCFRRYAGFSGRASRPEYWWFFLFLFLGTIVAGILDGLLFGAADVSATYGDGAAGVSAGSNGPVGLVFSLGTLLPGLAAGWRRMHDTGRSGLYLLYPLIVMAGLGTFGALMGALPGPDGSISAVQGVAGILFLVGAIVFMISPLLVLWWLTRPSQPGMNEYGPNPYGVVA